MSEITLFNSWEQITITFNGIDYKVPAWEVSVSEALANHILFIAKKWKLNICRKSDLNKVKETKVTEEVKVVEEPVKAEEEVAEEVVEEIEEKEEEVVEEIQSPKKNKKK